MLKLILLLFISIQFTSFSQYLIDNEEYSYHSFELLEDIDLTMDFFGDDSIAVAVKSPSLDFIVSANREKEKFLLQEIGILVERQISDDYRLQINIVDDSLLLIENYLELPAQHPRKDEYSTDSVLINANGEVTYIYTSQAHLFRENSCIYNLKTKTYYVQDAHKIYGQKLKNSPSIQFGRLKEKENGYVTRIIYSWNRIPIEIVEIGELAYEDKDEFVTMIPTGLSKKVYSYFSDDIFWNRLNGVDFHEKYPFLND